MRIRLPARLPVLFAVVGVLVLSSACSYHAGTAAAEKFDDWVKDHPIRGARIVDTVGNNKYAFSGELTAYARLTAEPTDASITNAMIDLCAFDKVAKVPTDYWLQVERISMQVICSDEGRTALAEFYDATKDLTTLTSVFLDRAGIQAEAPDAVVPEVAGLVFAAATASRTVGTDGKYTFDGEHVHVETVPGTDLTPELAATAAILPVVGDKITKLKVTEGLVVAETSGTVPEARQWQAAVTAGAGATLLVLPDRITADNALSPEQRALVEKVSTDQRVTLVSTYPDHWVVDVAEIAAARPLLRDLAKEPAVGGLGQLTIERVVDYMTCYVLPTFPADGSLDPAADALLTLCGRDDMPAVDGRMGFLDVRTTGDDLKAVLVAAHALPDGTQVSIQSRGTETSGTYSFTTGPTLTFDQDFASNAKLEAIWESLG